MPGTLPGSLHASAQSFPTINLSGRWLPTVHIKKKRPEDLRYLVPSGRDRNFKRAIGV